MSIWATMKKTINTAGDASSILDRLASDNVASLSRGELGRLCGKSLPTEAVEALGQIFALAAEELRSGLEHDFFGELILLAGELGGADFYIPEALDYLQSVLEHQPKTRYEEAYASQAVDSLLHCLKRQNPKLIEAALIAFGIVIARVPGPDRKRLLEAAENSSFDIVKEPLFSSLKRYHDRLTRLDKAIDASTWTVDDALSVITIHSHKGGVGKTTVAIALALELANRRRRVCVVDCDDEGPSLHFYLPVDAAGQKDVRFFCDWFCTDQSSLPQGLVQPVHEVDRVSFIAGSFLGVDITRLDEYVTLSRQRSNSESRVEGRIVLLIQLLRKEGFNSVILDTSPGLDRLSLDVLAASIRIKGSRVFVMRPRPVDIGQLCLEEDWIVALRTLGGSNEIVLNYFHPEGDETFNLLDPLALATELTKWPQFAAYSKRFSTEDISRQVQEMVKRTWPKFNVAKLHHAEGLQDAGSLQGSSMISIIRNTEEIQADAKRILTQIQDGWK
jgi:Mrp family chromosome partitioning ATPase